MAKLTKKVVDATQPDPAKDVFVWDDDLSGLALRVFPSGKKSFLVQYRNVQGQTRRYTVGRYGVLTPEQARTLAAHKLLEVANGKTRHRHAGKAAPRSPSPSLGSCT